MCEVQLLPLCTDSLEGGEAFSNGFSSEFSTVGIEVKPMVPAPFPGQISEEELGLPERKPACNY